MCVGGSTGIFPVIKYLFIKRHLFHLPVKYDLPIPHLTTNNMNIVRIGKSTLSYKRNMSLEETGRIFIYMKWRPSKKFLGKCVPLPGLVTVIVIKCRMQLHAYCRPLFEKHACNTMTTILQPNAKMCHFVKDRIKKKCFWGWICSSILKQGYKQEDLESLVVLQGMLGYYFCLHKLYKHSRLQQSRNNLLNMNLGMHCADCMLFLWHPYKHGQFKQMLGLLVQLGQSWSALV